MRSRAKPAQSIWPLDFKQWGYVRYNKTPNSQEITTPLSFSSFYGGFMSDIGIKAGIGGTYCGICTDENGKLRFLPLLGPNKVSGNGTDYRWVLFCK